MFNGRNPFSDPPGDAPGDPQQAITICCPVCSSEKFDGHSNEFEIYRVCRDCGNRWSGGSMAAARPDPRFPAPPPGVPFPDVEDDDGPVYTGAGFRDLNRNYDWDE